MTSAERGGRDWPISDQRKGGCLNLVLTGGGGPKSKKISRPHRRIHTKVMFGLVEDG